MDYLGVPPTEARVRPSSTTQSLRPSRCKTAKNGDKLDRMQTTWTHRVARVMVRPLIGTPITPNHLTTLRLVVGLGAAAAVALGTPVGNVWGGCLWVLSALLDRADGELARMTNRCSASGHVYDYLVDTWVNAIFFLAIGVGQRTSGLGVWAPVLGALACVSMLAACWIAEEFEKDSLPGVKTVSGGWGFDPDDALYLLAPVVWLGRAALVPAVILAAFGTTGFMLAFATRLLHQRRMKRLPATSGG